MDEEGHGYGEVVERTVAGSEEAKNLSKGHGDGEVVERTVAGSEEGKAFDERRGGVGEHS